MNKIKEWFSHLEKTQKMVLIFILTSFLLIFSLSIFNSINPSEKDNSKGDIEDLNVHDKLEVKDENEDENDKDVEEDIQIQEGTSEKTENQTDQTESPTHSQSVPNDSNNQVDSEGTKEESQEQAPVVQYINIQVMIKGLNGELITSQTIEIEEGKSAFDALVMTCNLSGIKLNATGFGPTIYVTEINGLKEKQHGAKSGWKYNINGNYVSSSSGGYLLKDKDVMEWYYEHD